MQETENRVQGIASAKDRTNSINYFGSASSISQDFTEEQRQSFTITRDILWASPDATISEVTTKENELIRQHKSNDPSVGYNQLPRLLKAIDLGEGFIQF